MEDFIFSDLPTTSLDVGGRKFDMVNLCLKSSTRNLMPRLYWCAANRVVAEENLTGKIPGLYGRLKDGKEFNSRGTMTLRRVNDVPGSTEEQRRWHIMNAEFVNAN